MNVRAERLLAVAVVGVVLAAVAPAPALAQGNRPCSVIFTGVERNGVVTTSTRAFTTATGARQTFVSGGVDATCAGQGNRLLADSAEHYEDRGELILIDRVRYSEPRMSLQSDRMIYYTGEERLFATGNVRGRTNTGTRFEGPQIDYYRAKPGVRAEPHWRAPGRPFVRMPQADEGSAAGTARPAAGARVPRDSIDLTADLVLSQNDSLVWASGKVVIERPDLLTTSDSAALDQGTGFARLRKEPRITGRGERPFALTGVELDLWSKEQKIDRVLASGQARIVSDSLTLDSDTIDLRIADQKMERVHAWGTRARADTPQQEMEADSLDVRMPGQQLRELHAIGRAIARTRVDTARILSDERDWITGDTIVALFDTLPAGDTSQTARMREVTATGSARAFYQMAPSGGVKGEPNLSYNRGREIIVSFKDGEVDQVLVKEQASGLFMEPIKSDSSTSTDKTIPKGGAKPEQKPESKPPTKPDTKPTSKPDPKPPAKPGVTDSALTALPHPTDHQ